MKKSFLEADKLRLALLVSIGAGIAGIILRCVQYFTILEPKTGFYSEQNATVPILFGLLLVASVAILFFSFSEQKFNAKEPTGRQSILAIIALVVGIGFILDAISQVGSIVALVNLSESLIDISGLYESFFAMFLRKGGLISVFQIIFAILSAAYFFLVSLSYMRILRNFSAFKYLALAPLLWTILRILTRFMRTIRYRNVSELLLELFALVSMMLFLMAFARLSSRVNVTGSLKRLYAYGLVAVMFGLVTSVPRLILTIAGSGDKLATDHPSFVVDFALPVFALAYLIVCMYSAKKRATTVKPVAKAEIQDDSERFDEPMDLEPITSEEAGLLDESITYEDDEIVSDEPMILEHEDGAELEAEIIGIEAFDFEKATGRKSIFKSDNDDDNI